MSTHEYIAPVQGRSPPPPARRTRGRTHSEGRPPVPSAVGRKQYCVSTAEQHSTVHGGGLGLRSQCAQGCAFRHGPCRGTLTLGGLLIYTYSRGTANEPTSCGTVSAPQCGGEGHGGIYIQRPGAAQCRRSLGEGRGWALVCLCDCLEGKTVVCTAWKRRR